MISSMMLAISQQSQKEKHNYHIRATRINQTLILTKQGILFRGLVVWNCQGSASPRKQKAKNERKKAEQHEDYSFSTGWERKGGHFLSKAVFSKQESHIRNLECTASHKAAPLLSSSRACLAPPLFGEL